MIDAKQLLADLQKRVRLLEDDLRTRCNELPDVDAPLKAEYESARSKGRTGLTYNAWRDEELTQIAVAWILSGVFVRFLEDNELIEVPFIAGATPVRQQRAHDEHSLFFRQQPTASERDYFEHVFTEMGKLPGLRDFFSRRHNPLWHVGPSADAARDLLNFWQKTDPDTGRIHHDFTDPESNTRFLGDLYQDLSEFARKRYALLQTPVFVEQFILDRTLTPSINTFGYRAVRMIDITCGSGHFLLGGFHRLFRLWQDDAPGDNPAALVQRALDQVYGVDLNPNVVAIARFRLLVAALRACGVTRIKNAPDFQLNIAAGDSLLHGSRFPMSDSHEGVQQTFGSEELFRDELKHFYESEDREELHRILGQQYHVVVGNPPYITVKDKALNEAYRKRYDSCHRAYSLAVPFMERFFDLAVKGVVDSQQPAGYVGMITSNSFMKREFGKKLIEEFIPKWDLTHVIDTAGAYIPGHGTPTVILFGKHQLPVVRTIRTVMGIQGEPATPADPARGLVWSAILGLVDAPGSESRFISVADTARESFRKHPWSLGGGGAAELKEIIDEAGVTTIEDHADDMGFGVVTRQDDAYQMSAVALRRNRIANLQIKDLVTGDNVRDWQIVDPPSALWPYDSQTLATAELTQTVHLLWPCRRLLVDRVAYGKTQLERGLAWFEYSMFFRDRYRQPRSITYACVATHNHFVFDEAGRLFNRHAPLIKLKGDADVDDHLRLLAMLNSSTGCFWMKQVFYPKGGDHQGDEGARVRTTLWDERYEFTGTQVGGFPVPAEQPLVLTKELDRLAGDMKSHEPSVALTAPANHTRAALDGAKQRWAKTLQRMIALQEELDWECYQLYGLSEAKLVLPPDQVPPLQLGERAFEIVMARKLVAGELQTTWFERHGSTPITELPTHWPKPYRELVECRIALMESDRNIALIEQPEYKRRWNVEPWDEQLERALREWLLIRLEGYFFEGHRVNALSDGFSPAAHGFTAATQAAVVSTNQLAAVVEADKDFLHLAEIYTGSPTFSVSKLVRELVEKESVPFLPFQRYKETGLRKRQDWEHVWDLQRQEDAIEAQEKVDEPGIPDDERKARKQRAAARKKQEIGDIPVPPKYASADFRSSSYWKLRGKLDVPKERWVIYSGAEREGDPSPVIAWAGWDHLQQAQALAAYYIHGRDNWGWPPEKLKPLLAGVAELLPWLKQWHNEFNPDLGSGVGDYFASFLDEESRRQGARMEPAVQRVATPVVPSPTWMDRPLIVPVMRRVALEPERYRSALVPQLLYQAGGRLSFERFRRAYWLLTEPNLLEKFAKNELGPIAQQWGKEFCDSVRKEEFLEHLKGAVRRQLQFIRVQNERWMELREINVSDDAHIIFDARLALLVADLWPSDTPITPLTGAEENFVRELELA